MDEDGRFELLRRQRPDGSEDPVPTIDVIQPVLSSENEDGGFENYAVVIDGVLYILSGYRVFDLSVGDTVDFSYYEDDEGNL